MIKILPITLAMEIFFGTGMDVVCGDMGYNVNDILNNDTIITCNGKDEQKGVELLTDVIIPEDVYVRFTRGSEGKYPHLTNVGLASAMGHDGLYAINVNMDRCEICDPYEIKEVIRHELVHIDQMKRGDLMLYKGQTIWKGQNYGNEVAESIIGISKGDTGAMETYIDFPWEMEAYGIDKIPALRGAILTVMHSQVKEVY